VLLLEVVIHCLVHCHGVIWGETVHLTAVDLAVVSFNLHYVFFLVFVLAVKSGYSFTTVQIWLILLPSLAKLLRLIAGDIDVKIGGRHGAILVCFLNEPVSD